MKTTIAIAAFFVFFFIGCNTNSGKQEVKPNIVLVLADDLGVPQVGCYGSSYYETPNIDKLASRGARFTNAYAAAAVCSPTRAAILTGKNPARLHLTDFIAGNNDDNYPLLQPPWQKFLPLEETTIAEVLKEHSYKTALFGKWHLSKEKAPPVSLEHNPDKQGFDESFVTYKPSKSNPLGDWQTAENDAHNVDTITSRAIDFIERNKDTPFLLILSHNSIHDPIMEKKISIDYFEGKEGVEQEENNPVIAAMVQRMDNAFGRLYHSIEQLGLLENTVVIFYSDNGAKESYAKQTPFKKGKGWLYEGGIREPFIIQWKGKIEKNVSYEAPITSMDLFPTILDLTGTPYQFDSLMDGISVKPLLMDNQPLANRNLFWNYPHYHKGSGMVPASAVRSGNYKLIKWYEPQLLEKEGVYELYDLKTDVGESRNLAKELPEKVKELDELLENWKREVDAQEPLINDGYEKGDDAN